MSSHETMYKIYIHPDPAIVHLAKNVLATHGIETIVRGEYTANPIGGMALIDNCAALWILDESLVQEAVRILDEAFDPAAVDESEPWRCSDCGEEIEEQFAVCWNCGAERPEEAA